MQTRVENFRKIFINLFNSKVLPMHHLKPLAAKFNISADSKWLLEAFTHRSYAVEHNLTYDNQRLEFLGDSVLEIVLTEHLFKLYPAMTEGDMTKTRSALACEGSLAVLARKLDLGSYLRIGRGEQGAGGIDRDSTLADLFEAFTGALYLESGFEAARLFLLDQVNSNFPDPRRLLVELNPKGKLQEFSQQHWNEIPHYTVFRHSGPQHLPLYEVEVTLRCYTAMGSGRSRKQAEFNAASQLFQFLRNRGVIKDDF
ncbi:MAG: ribonuclease III [Lentisphaerae bacterium]|nr:ribonuclease III [Lentisphaerota bacterium]